MKKKILFVYDMKKGTPWKDGLWAALNLLEKDFAFIDRRNLSICPDLSQKPIELYDFVLGWGAFDSAVDKFMQHVTSKKGLCIAGTTNPPNAEATDYGVLFYETDWQKQNQLLYCSFAVKAFGVNTDIFKPIQQEKIWDYIGVGSLSTWKRWECVADKPGTKLVIGHYQMENEGESGEYARWLVANDVMVSNEVEPEILAKLYNASKVCYMPSNMEGGGERAVWEAKACGIPVEVESDNPKLQELVDAPVRDHYYYYFQLLKGIESVI